MKTFAVLPVKCLDRCKQRLSGALSDFERSELMREMFIRACKSALSCEMINTTVVVSDDHLVRSLAIDFGAVWLPEGDKGTHSLAASVGVKYANSHDADRVALIAGDCPLITPTAIENLISAADDHEDCVVIAHDRHATGTNALLLQPPSIIQPAFGSGSLAEHTRRALNASAIAQIVDIAEIAFDVDTPDDLQLLTEMNGTLKT